MKSESSDTSENPPILRVSTGFSGSFVEPLKLGQRVREARRRHKWTLEEASQHTGLARSTLSKIENDQMSPTFEVVHKLSIGLGLDVPQLFASATENRSSGRRIITRGGEGRAHPTPTYEHELLCTQITNKRMIPFKSRIHARDLSSFEGWVRHEGEEFLIVLEGSIIFHSEFYEPVTLDSGDSVYYDSGMGHACVSATDEDALVLWVCTPH